MFFPIAFSKKEKCYKHKRRTLGENRFTWCLISFQENRINGDKIKRREFLLLTLCTYLFTFFILHFKASVFVSLFIFPLIFFYFILIFWFFYYRYKIYIPIEKKRSKFKLIYILLPLCFTFFKFWITQKSEKNEKNLFPFLLTCTFSGCGIVKRFPIRFTIHFFYFIWFQIFVPTCCNCCVLKNLKWGTKERKKIGRQKEKKWYRNI